MFFYQTLVWVYHWKLYWLIFWLSYHLQVTPKQCQILAMLWSLTCAISSLGQKCPFEILHPICGEIIRRTMFPNFSGKGQKKMPQCFSRTSLIEASLLEKPNRRTFLWEFLQNLPESWEQGGLQNSKMQKTFERICKATSLSSNWMQTGRVCSMCSHQFDCFI